MALTDTDADHTRSPGARQIYEALKQQIINGVFGVAGQLPSSRTLANELGVSRTTVSSAYDQLLAEGFIEVRQGARPSVAPAAANRAQPSPAQQRTHPARLSAYAERIRSMPPWPAHVTTALSADFRYGDLAPADFPTSTWKRALNAAIAQRPSRLSYIDSRGSLRLRTALQGYLWRARTLRCSVNQIIIVNGSQQGLDLCARLLLNPDDRFVIENPCYAMAHRVFSASGAQAVPVTVDHHGLDTSLLEGIEARLAYVTPSHQFPLGGVMPVTRRMQLLDWAQRNDAYVIEDDYDSEYRYDIKPVTPLHGLGEHDNVIYLGTVSKTLSPTLRIGYLVVPESVQEVFATAKQVMDRHSPLTEQTALASLIENGWYEQHVRRSRRLNGDRRATLLRALQLHFGDNSAVEGTDAGLHVVIWLKQLHHSQEQQLIERARTLGVGVYPISRLYHPLPPDQSNDRLGLVIGYASLNPHQIETGIRLLAMAVDQTASL